MFISHGGMLGLLLCDFSIRTGVVETKEKEKKNGLLSSKSLMMPRRREQGKIKDACGLGWGWISSLFSQAPPLGASQHA